MTFSIEDRNDCCCVKYLNTLDSMSKGEIKHLRNFLAPFPQRVRENTLWLREFVLDLYPDCDELIYDNYNALAICFSLTEKVGDGFCHIAVYGKHVNFGFNRGSELADPENRLQGSGRLVRHLSIHEKSDFPSSYMKRLLREARQNSLLRLKERKRPSKGEAVVKSISPIKRRPK